MLCSVVKHLGSGDSTQEVERNTRLRLVFPPTLLSCYRRFLSACFQQNRAQSRFLFFVNNFSIPYDQNFSKLLQYFAFPKFAALILQLSLWFLFCVMFDFKRDFLISKFYLLILQMGFDFRNETWFRKRGFDFSNDFVSVHVNATWVITVICRAHDRREDGGLWVTLYTGSNHFCKINKREKFLEIKVWQLNTKSLLYIIRK